VDFARYEITEHDAREAATRGVVVVTTLAGSAGTGSADYQEKLRRLHLRNLGLLKKSGVSLAIGSDEYRQTSVPEAMYLSQLGVFNNAELLQIWCDNSARAVFPKRKIGRLTEGYEASFLVLTGDPIRDFANTRKIELRVKQGSIISIAH
jgi:imidazolonepropionase-like amidohydrolase